MKTIIREEEKKLLIVLTQPKLTRAVEPSNTLYNTIFFYYSTSNTLFLTLCLDVISRANPPNQLCLFRRALSCATMVLSLSLFNSRRRLQEM